MRINLFRGARRVAVVIASVLALSVGIVVWFIWHEDYVKLALRVDKLNSTPRPIDSCPYDTGVGHHYDNLVLDDGRSINVTVCFMPSKTSNGEMLIPYADAGNNQVWMGGEFDTEVRTYMREVFDDYQHIHKGDPALAARIDSIEGQGTKWAVASAAATAVLMWIATAIVGWVVRGFLGVPPGHDFPAENREQREG